MTTISSLSLDLEHLGLRPSGSVLHNLSVPRLLERAITLHEGAFANNGAFAARTGKRTGRSPGDKFVVRYPNTISGNQVAWGNVNQPFEPVQFERLKSRVCEYLQARDLYVLDAVVGADSRYSLPIRLVTEFAWHTLFAHQLFRRLDAQELASHQPTWTILAAPRFHADPERDGTNSETFIGIDPEQQLVLICGSEYAGEIKKSIFTVMNYILPQKGVLPMHCSANVDGDGDVALFFGLSGTGKTTLSADPGRNLIGDDEHGWSDHGVFNIEGGCYAKCINLTKSSEPQIWNAIRFGSVMENVAVDAETGEPDYYDSTFTENTRVAYPVEYIDNAELSGVAGHPSTVVFLTADAFGVLPPIARLTIEQAKYHFLSGYTAKTAGTEVGVKEPEATFSTCFGAPFLPLQPQVYADMLGEKLAQHDVQVFLLNTGWTGGPYGVGKRISLGYTRAMVDAALSGKLDHAETTTDPVFGLQVPTRIPGVPDELLRPRDTWADGEAYDQQARQLAKRFVDNFTKFADVDDEIRAAGPKID